MSARVELEGFDELMHQLTNAPQELRSQGMDIIREETEAAAKDIEAAYPRKTGTLARRVRTSYPSSTVLVGIVQSAAPHSHLFEFGTKDRRTDDGYNRGRMPEHKVTPDIAQRHRFRMFDKLKDLLTRVGFQVS